MYNKTHIYSFHIAFSTQCDGGVVRSGDLGDMTMLVEGKLL